MSTRLRIAGHPVLLVKHRGSDCDHIVITEVSGDYITSADIFPGDEEVSWDVLTAEVEEHFA